jgi:hypothetical protein
MMKKVQGPKRVKAPHPEKGKARKYNGRRDLATRAAIDAARARAKRRAIAEQS